ncbi:MAG: hypothetical protein R3A49_01875 [Acidimicrobiia bacterium]
MAIVTVVVGCVPPGNPGTEDRNKFLEATAGGYAIGLNANVAPRANGTTKACPDHAGVNHWGTADEHGVWKGPFTVCYTLGLPTSNAHRGTVYMHEMGHVYAQRLVEVGSTWAQGPINNAEKFADCFAQLHGGNTAFNGYWGGNACTQSWVDKIAQMEAFAPPNNSTGWWTP